MLLIMEISKVNWGEIEGRRTNVNRTDDGRSTDACEKCSGLGGCLQRGSSFERGLWVSCSSATNGSAFASDDSSRLAEGNWAPKEIVD